MSRCARTMANSFVLIVLATMTACDSDKRTAAGDPGATAGDGGATVTIIEPAHEASVDGPTVRIVLEATGVTIVPAGENQPNSGHHHLLLNADMPPMTEAIPSEEGRYIHLGKGQTEYLLENLQPGEHTVIALVGDFAHVPIDPPVADTVVFAVR